MWGSVEVPYEDFAEYVEEIGHTEAPSHAAELYLTAACRLRCPVALQMLNEQYIARLELALKNVVRDAWVVGDILQDVRTRLLVGPSSKIACYRGCGPLGSWIRTIAINIARDHVRATGSRRRREQRLCRLWDSASGGSIEDNVGACIVRRGRAGACVEAVRLAFQSLEPGERHLLRDYFFLGLSIDTLGPHHGVNRATIARRIRRTTDKIHRTVRRHLTSSHPREDARTLDVIALAACRDMIVDLSALLE